MPTISIRLPDETRTLLAELAAEFRARGLPCGTTTILKIAASRGLPLVAAELRGGTHGGA